MNCTAPIIHHVQFATQAFGEMKAQGTHRSAFRDSRDLTIFTAHNYHEKSLLEQNLAYLGLAQHVVLKKSVRHWSHIKRVLWFLDFMNSDRCTTDLVMHCDADDVIIRDDPQKIADLFYEFGCDLLYCATRYPNGYKCMPSTKRWADRVHKKRYLNAGAFIGKREFAIEVYSQVAKYVTSDDVHASEFFANERRFRHDFPRGIGCDQTILRYLEPSYYPRLRIDAENRLFWRNDNRKWYEQLYANAKRRTPKELKRPVKRILGLPVD